MQRLTLTVPEVAEALGISRMTAYAAVRGGAIPSLRIGRRLLIPRVVLDRLIDAVAAPPASEELPPVQGPKAIDDRHHPEPGTGDPLPGRGSAK